MKTLKKIVINPKKVLKNEELVNLKGGYGGTCAAMSPSGSCFDNLSRTEAIFMAGCDPDGTNCDGGHWCCDSCSEASWYPCQ